LIDLFLLIKNSYVWICWRRSQVIKYQQCLQWKPLDHTRISVDILHLLDTHWIAASYWQLSKHMIYCNHTKQESPAHADKPARRGSMQKLLQFDVFRSFHRILFRQISNYRCLASRDRPIWLYIVWNPVFANYKVSYSNYKYLVLRLFS